MDLTQSYFDHLRKLLDLEKAEDSKSFEESIRFGSIQQRAEAGLAWYPLRIVETGYGFGDYPFVVVERTRNQKAPHQFGPGKPVRLFSSDAAEEEEVNGAVEKVFGDQMKIVFFRDELPEILDFGKLGIQILFDEQSYKLAYETLDIVKNAKNCRLAELRNILLGLTDSSKDLESYSFASNESLNYSQNESVKLILETQDVCIIHGPPGTGKTTTLIEAAKQLVQQGARILITTPSNAAADHVSLSLLKSGIKVVRAGNPVRISADLESITTEGLLKTSSNFQIIKESRKRADEFRRMASKYKRNFGPEERAQRKLLQQEAHALSKEATKMERMVVDSIFEMAQVVTSTLVGASNSVPSKIYFDYVFIDEAAQAPEHLCWIPILKANRLVMAGDPFQLPPTIKSDEASKGGLSITLMEKLMNHVPVSLLKVQYRMNPAIMAFPNLWFYKGLLEAAEHLNTRFLKEDSGITFLDTAGLGYEEQSNQSTRSFTNPGEVTLILKQLEIISDSLDSSQYYTVALISPYSEQVRLLNEEFSSFFPNGFPFLKVNIQTIDSFQGQERDIVFVSLVRSNARNEIGFLKDYRRMNVAMTRAKFKLMMVGDSATLANDVFYDKLITFCMDQGHYQSAWEFIA
jgi:ATP-dependent RNA/DNA helicase IGHMBP2